MAVISAPHVAASGTSRSGGAGALATLRGRKIAIISYGSRGDIQPFVALGARLVQEGCGVTVLTNVDHEDFVTSFGLKIAVTAGSCREDHECPEFAHGIATGDFGPFFAWQFQDKAAKMPDISEAENAAVADFAPDLIYATPLTYQNACRMSAEFGVPMILGSLFPAENPLSNLGFRPFQPPPHPTLIHWTPELTKVRPWQTRSHKVTGFLIVGGQEEEVQAQQDHVFGGAEARCCLESFLEAGEPPVYMGWGSMVVPGDTVCLAVRALKQAGLRGVILGGWAKLGARMLEGQPDQKELEDYAAESVLFVQTAPHEWLFPRCAATVHHGGAGTVAAALRAGVPTVITPCGLDQPDNARIVEQSGCGVALPQISQVTAEQLGSALAHCAGDGGMRARCLEVAQTLRSEDGLGETISEISKYLLQQDMERARGAVPERAGHVGLQVFRQMAQQAGSVIAQHVAQHVAQHMVRHASRSDA